MSEIPTDTADRQLTDMADDFPTAPEIAGNVPDPDATTLDHLVEQDATPPTPEEMPKDKGQPQVKPHRPARLIGVTETIYPTWAPQLLMPADPTRQGLRIRVDGTATEHVRIGESANAVQSLHTCAAFYVGDDVWIVPGYDGPVWGYAPDVTASVTVSLMAVAR